MSARPTRAGSRAISAISGDLQSAATGADAAATLGGIDGHRPDRVESLVDFFAEPHNEEALDELLAEVKIEPMQAIATGHPLAGKTIVFTGSLERMTRDEAKAMAERLGRRCPARSRPRPTSSSPAPAPARN